MENNIFFNNLHVKVVSSCVRNQKVINEQFPSALLSESIDVPKEGDLVVAKIIGQSGAYTKIENINGREIPLYCGDIIIGVLGTRSSGTSPSGKIPTGPICKGQTLGLLAAGGIVGDVIAVPAYYGKGVLQIEVIGFPILMDKQINIRNCTSTENKEADILEGSRIIFVAATSAEAGKTTFISKTIRYLIEKDSKIRVSGIKVVGTGRYRDILSYKDSGASFIADFVDTGWPTTYNMSVEEYQKMLFTLLRQGSRNSDYLFVEIGGDLFEGNAPIAIQAAAKLGAIFAFVVNDAVGAYGGLQILKKYGIEKPNIVSMRQNIHSLSERLELETAYDLLEKQDIVRFVNNLPTFINP